MHIHIDPVFCEASGLRRICSTSLFSMYAINFKLPYRLRGPEEKEVLHSHPVPQIAALLQTERVHSHPVQSAS